jgi:hypothetical protein
MIQTAKRAANLWGKVKYEWRSGRAIQNATFAYWMAKILHQLLSSKRKKPWGALPTWSCRALCLACDSQGFWPGFGKAEPVGKLQKENNNTNKKYKSAGLFY